VTTEGAQYPSSDELLAAAVAAAGLDDFGPGDFRLGVDKLLESLARDAPDLTPAAAAGVVGGLHRRLVNRLEVEAWYRDHPEIEGQSVQGPIDINGLPRTGTTAMANMMSLDPQFRCLRGWEQVQPPTRSGRRRCTRCTCSTSTPRWRTPRCSGWRSTASST
jgi:hypothetical protein